MAATTRAATMRAATAAAAPGLYIAWGPWLDIAHGPGQLHKVGHTGDLGGRLLDSAYVTCFPADHWRYVATFETQDKSDAHLLETAVLHCCRERRLAGRELVRLPAADIIAVAAAAAARLAIGVVRRDAPVYPARVRPSFGPCLGAADSAADAEPRWAAARAQVEDLTVRAAPAQQAPENDFIDELLSAVLPAAPPAEPPAARQAHHSNPASRPPPRQQEDLVLDEVDDAEFAAAMGAVEAEIAASPFDIHARAPAPIEARDYQRTATALCLAELRREGKAILQMACRCGKTPVAFGVLRDFLALGAADERPINALYLVPGLSLLRQTAQKLASYGFAEPILLVGSDPRPVPLAGAGALVMTTDPAVIRAFVNERGRRLVISTYQSSPQVPTDAFGLTICDEAHRVCGGQAPRPFNHFVMAPRVGCRLFMTATPAYDPPSKTAITMKDRALFGGVAYRYHLRQGIAAGHVNDFRLEVIAAPAPAAPAGGAEAPTAEDVAMPAQLLAAMAKVDKLLVFCRNIGHAARLCAALEGAPRPSGVRPFECLVAHSRMGPGGAAGALRRFATPGERAVLFNCRLFQEGVEIPALNAVFFAAPRHSPRDIIQSVCRPLNRAAGKPVSVVFLPVLHDPARRPDDPANLNRYASIIPFVDALLDEDPRLYEHLLDPVASPYPIDILGTHTLDLGSAASRGALLAAIRRAVRYGAGSARGTERLLRVENVPWDRAFAEIRRVVETCGRYPKTTDAWVVGEARVCLHRFYNWARGEFAAWRAGDPSKLEPHQIHDLLGLPHWEPFGVEGPYPWRICMEFLAQWLREHGGVAPMVEINKGGYIGLEATAIERLSGALTCVNQQDGKDKKGGKPGSGYGLAPEKQADLERVCAPYGLRWRKERDAAGALVKGGEPTFIQEAYARFKAYYKAHGAHGDYVQRWFPGYPHKHARQENLAVQEAGAAPPRWRTGRRARADGE